MFLRNKSSTTFQKSLLLWTTCSNIKYIFKKYMYQVSYISNTQASLVKPSELYLLQQYIKQTLGHPNIPPMKLNKSGI